VCVCVTAVAHTLQMHVRLVLGACRMLAGRVPGEETGTTSSSVLGSRPGAYRACNVQLHTPDIWFCCKPVHNCCTQVQP
jgi:hypothetical protein